MAKKMLNSSMTMRERLTTLVNPEKGSQMRRDRLQEERRRLAGGVAFLPCPDCGGGRETSAERAARSGETQAGDRARDNHCCITHFLFLPSG